jgi:hypothetical protein
VIENRLSEEDWEILGEYVEFLDPLAIATQVLQGNPGKHSSGQQKRGLAANVLLAFEFILNHMEKTNEKYQGRGAKDRHLSAAVELAWDKCTEYYRKLDDTPIYLAGVILHPSHKWQRLETLWGNSKKTKKWIQDGKAKIKAFWESEYKSMDEQDNTPTEQSTSTRSEFEMFLDGRARKDLTPGDEYEKWCQLEPFQHDNALSYWIENRARWPKLSRMAIDIFSIPAMSAEPERVFSMAGAMCSPRRSRLNAKSIQVCQCLRSWHSAGIIDDNDLFASAGGGKPPDAGEELAQAFEGFRLEEEEGKEDDEGEDEEDNEGEDEEEEEEEEEDEDEEDEEDEDEEGDDEEDEEDEEDEDEDSE